MEETQRSRSRRSSGQAGRLRRCNLPVVARRAITKRLRLLAKNKDAGLPGEAHFLDLAIFADQQGVVAGLDRKSTRLNSSHVSISYAVFCLKKKSKLQVVSIHVDQQLH